MKTWKRNAIIAGVLVLVCAGIYLNWLYGRDSTDLTKVLDADKVLGESTLVLNDTTQTQPALAAQESGQSANEYFAQMRLSRQKARDQAVELLQETIAYAEGEDTSTSSKALEGIVSDALAAPESVLLPDEKEEGVAVVDIGGGTAEVAVISMGSIVASRSVRSAGDEFEKEIIAYVKRKYNVLIGDRTAEEIKIAIASAAPYEGEEPYSVMGRNLVDGFPKEVTLTPAEIREVLSEQIGVIIDAILTTLERTPPELSADILETGITLAGGGAMLHGMDKLVAQQTGMPVFIAEEPLDCVARGTGAILESPETFSRTLFFDNRPSR